MAKRSYKKRKQPVKKTKKTASKIDLTVIGLILLSILLAVLIYGKSGVIGIKLNEILGGMMGIIRYVLPIGIFAIGIKLACEDNEYLTSKLIQYTILLISFSVLMEVYQINTNELVTTGKELSEVVKDAYAIGAQGTGGGVLGAVLAVPLVNLLGSVGAAILCVGIVIMLAVFTFGINMSDIINNIVEKSEEKREEKLEQKQKYKEEAARLRQEKQEQRRKALEVEPKQQIQDEAIGEQIKINFGGRAIEEQDTKNGRKKYNHDGDDLVPLTKENKKLGLLHKKEELQPDVIENNIFKKEEGNLFKTEEEKKEDKTKEVLHLEHAMIVEDENYEYPPIELLGKPSKKALKGGAKALTDTATKLQKTLYSFGVSAKVENVSVGPAITRYELKPAEGVRVSKIANLADDIALNLAAETIRIEAPIPG